MEGMSGRSEVVITIYNFIPRSLSGALSAALTGIFVFVGAFGGGITGGLAGRASDCGALRGAGLGALAGAVLSVEILETLRAYSREGLFGRRDSSLADFMVELLRGRLSELHFLPELLIANHLQVSVHPVDVLDSNKVAYKGLSEDLLRSLPCHEILDECKPNQSICCAICLQDTKVGDIARSLPQCRHMFHQTCVDKWLSRHGSCPICRQLV